MLGTGGPGLEVWKGVFMLASAFAFGRVMNPTDEGQNYTPPTPPFPFFLAGGSSLAIKDSTGRELVQPLRIYLLHAPLTVTDREWIYSCLYRMITPTPSLFRPISTSKEKSI